MKRLAAIPIALIALTKGISNDGLIPFKDFFVSVTTNQRKTPNGGGESLVVRVAISRSQDDPEGSAKVEVSCPGFDWSASEFTGADLDVYFKAIEALKEGRTFQKEILSPTPIAAIRTRFETAHNGARPILNVTRGNTTVFFTRDEAETTAEALALARSAEAWYRKLLSEKTVPLPGPGAFPPHGGLHVASTVGTVGDGEVRVEIGVRNWGAPESEYLIEMGLRGGNPGWWTAGRWVDEVVEKLSEAIVAGKSGKPYRQEISSARDRKNDAIYVAANPETGAAELMIRFGEGLLKDNPTAFGTFDAADLEAIRTLQAEGELRKRWFEDHEFFFLGPPLEKP